VKVYFAKVYKLLDDGRILWRVPGIIDNMGTYQPDAYPFSPPLTLPEINDNVMVIQWFDDIQDFWYYQIPEKGIDRKGSEVSTSPNTNFIGFRVNNVVIDLGSLDGSNDDLTGSINPPSGTRIDLKVLDIPWNSEIKDKKSPNVTQHISLDRTGITIEGGNSQKIKIENGVTTISGNKQVIETGLVKQVKMLGKVIPDPVNGGPFYAGPVVCPITGVPLCGNTIQNTDGIQFN
jgi:hypothetical protein